MCMGCWKNDGSPWEKTSRAVEWSTVFAGADRFGKLHAVIEDWNLDDGSLIAASYSGLSDDEVRLLNALLEMSMSERYATAILADDPDFDPALWRATPGTQTIGSSDA